MKTMWVAVSICVLALTAGSVPLAAEPAERIRFEMVKTALEQGQRRLAIDVLQDLVADSDDWRQTYYRAWILQLEGQIDLAAAEFERLLTAADDRGREPDWLYQHLLEQVAAVRLEERLAQADADLADLLARHHEARCGLERLQELDDLIAFGHMTVDETEIPLRLARKRPRFYRLDLFLPAGPQITATDGQVVWRISPSADGLRGESLSGSDAEAILDGSWFDDVLVRFAETAGSLFLAGVDALSSGDRAYRVEVDDPEGLHQSVFLDQDTLLESRRLIWDRDPQPPAITVTTEQGEFEGCHLPARQVVEAGGGTVEYAIESYRFDQPLNTAAFDQDSVLEQLRQATGPSGDDSQIDR